MSKILNYDRVKSDKQSAQLYTQRRPEKHNHEMHMVAEAFAMVPRQEVKTVLDAPCGVGRLSLWLGQQGFEVSAIDLGEAAIELTTALLGEAGIAAKVEIQNILEMSYANEQFDSTVCFRLLHHFESQGLQSDLIKELCRVTKKYVVISYFSPYSVTSIRRRIRKLITGKPVKQYPNTLAQLNSMFEGNGFRLKGRVKRSGFIHSLQLAVYRRID